MFWFFFYSIFLYYRSSNGFYFFNLIKNKIFLLIKEKLYFLSIFLCYLPGWMFEVCVFQGERVFIQSHKKNNNFFSAAFANRLT